MRFSVSFEFEAESLEAAEELVGEWTVTPGVTMLSILGHTPMRPPIEVGEDGSVGDALRRAPLLPADAAGPPPDPRFSAATPIPPPPDYGEPPDA